MTASGVGITLRSITPKWWGGRGAGRRAGLRPLDSRGRLSLHAGCATWGRVADWDFSSN